jgi:hypothetical protein
MKIISVESKLNGDSMSLNPDDRAVTIVELCDRTAIGRQGA